MRVALPSVIRWFSGAAGVALLAVFIGVLSTAEPQLAVVATLAILCAAALAAPAGYWAIAALIAALTFRGIVGLGVAPSVVTFIDIPLVWGALATALLRTRGTARPKVAKALLGWLIALAFAAMASWLFSDAELLRPILYFALLAEPFALVAALVLDPPSASLRRGLKLTLFVVIVAQVPIALGQAAYIGLRDPVQGTLFGAGAGAHTMSAVVAVGAIWIAATSRYPLAWRLPVVAVLATLPFLADAKQVIFALPAIVIIGRWRKPKDMIVRIAGVALALAALLFLLPAGRTSVNFLQQSRSGEGGKEQVARVLWDAAISDPGVLAFGQGPAETVSRAAFMTTELSLRPDSPLRVFDLQPAKVAIQAEGEAIRISRGGSSLNSGLSSALGVFGDLGLIGLAAYAGLLGSLLLALRSTGSPEGIAAVAGFSIFAVLGLVFDWWEQPPFSVVLAVLAGLALTEPHEGDPHTTGQQRDVVEA